MFFEEQRYKSKKGSWHVNRIPILGFAEVSTSLKSLNKSNKTPFNRYEQVWIYTHDRCYCGTGKFRYL
jgi:hypothetical protein